MPSISVVMPVRNEARFVGPAIESILGQTFADFELIVVDDGSTDRTPDLLDEYAGRDSRVKVLRNERPLGIAAALNRGIQASRAPLIARMDGDDLSAPERLERQKAFLDTRPHVVMCGTGAHTIDGAGAITGTWHPTTGYATLRSGLLTCNMFAHGTTMFRRHEAENAGLYSSDPAYAQAEDYELWVRLAARHEVDNVPEILYFYRSGPEVAEGRDPARQAASTDVIRTLASTWLASRDHGLDLPAGHTPVPPGRILVLIATYRDLDCQWTIQDLFARARRPDDITVGVCWQYDPRADADCFHLRTRVEQVRAIHVHINEARGLGWARHMTERLWTGEEYVLQIDGHMRFADGWDERLLDQLAACTSRFPVLTVYPWGFVLPRTTYDGPPLRMSTFKFHDSGLPAFAAAPIEEPPRRPPMHAFWAGGFAFSRADAVRDVPQDPYLYFTETEPTQSVRLWTHGWDLFAPSENVIWHCYGSDKHRPRGHWSDNTAWHAQAVRSAQRALHLLGVREADDPGATADLHRYALGRHRTLADYQAFAGIDFQARSIDDLARLGRCRPEYARPRFS